MSMIKLIGLEMGRITAKGDRHVSFSASCIERQTWAKESKLGQEAMKNVSLRLVYDGLLEG